MTKALEIRQHGLRQAFAGAAMIIVASQSHGISQESHLRSAGSGATNQVENRTLTPMKNQPKKKLLSAGLLRHLPGTEVFLQDRHRDADNGN